MKPDEDDCWYNGRDEFCKETYPGQYEWCSAEYHRCVECADHAHCPSERPWCDWDMECEECLVSAHCPPGESCLMRDGKWVCKRKDCVDYREEGDPDYCANNFPDTPFCDIERRNCVECVHPSDCEIGETCVENVCVAEDEKDCVDKENEGVYDYCAKLYPERPICHSQLRECVECQFVSHCDDGEDCVATRCLREDWECEINEDCMSDRWKCVDHECILKICSDYDDPDAFCDEKHTGWKCREDGICVKCLVNEDCPDDKKCANYKCWDKTCDERALPNIWCADKYGEEYKCIGTECKIPGEVETCNMSFNPDWWCRERFGADYRCVGNECKIPEHDDCRDYVSTAAADEFCHGLNSDRPFCDFDTGRCETCVLEQHCPPSWTCWNHMCRECFNNDDCDRHLKCSPDWTCIERSCDEIEYITPDVWCQRQHGDGYACVDTECVLAGCDGIDANCPKGYYCPVMECIWGCEDSDNCPGERPYCSQETGNCEECLGAVHCELGYVCVDHVCVKGFDCLRDDSLCPENEYCNVDTCEPGCRDSDNCGSWTPHCSQATGKCEECVYDLHCEAGHDCDDYKCVWVGYDCDDDSECPKNWMCHDQRKECIYGCVNDGNCSNDKPHCSQETGFCEECWSSIHCESWQECDKFVCVAKHGEDECVAGDVKPGYRCRDGVWVRMECHGPEDCLGHESCIDGLCVDNEHECEDVDDCVTGYFCDVDGSHNCKPQICVNHSGCGPGNCCGVVGSGGENGCESCSTYPCKYLEDPCPPGWICDRDTGYCREAECVDPSDCGDPNYKCEEGLCVAITCDDVDDPLGWCRAEHGWYYRCLEGNCILLNCSSYSDPDMMCIDMHGESYRCEGNRCVDRGPSGTDDPDKYCADLLGIDEAFWNYDTGKCDVPKCDTVQDPDGFCVQVKDERYKCRDGECRRGREGEECENPDECVPSLSCEDGVCMKYECYGLEDCEDDEWCVDHMCLPMNNTCEDDHDCRDDYHCDPNGICVPDVCDDHYDCGLGYCCNEFGVCIPCGELICFGNFDCRRGWRCNMTTSKCIRAGCQRDTDCDPGFWCDLNDGKCKEIEEDYELCWFDWNCPSGQVCKGQYVSLLINLQDLSWGQGICVDEDTRLIRIKGIDDEETCDYCRQMWKKVGREGEFKLPPYHEHCRCWGVYVD